MASKTYFIQGNQNTKNAETHSPMPIQPNDNVDRDAANTLMALRYGNQITPHKDPNVGSSSIQRIAQHNLMNVVETGIVRFREGGHLISADLQNGVVPEGHVEHLCNTCEARFETNSALIWHRQTHHSDRWAACEICPAEFGSAAELENHQRTAHKKPTESCTICDWKFSSKRSLGAHMRHHHSDRATRENEGGNAAAATRAAYQCMECDFSSEHLFSLSRHYNRLHTDSSPKFPCCYGCGYLSKSKWNRSRHEKSCPMAPGRD